MAKSLVMIGREAEINGHTGIDMRIQHDRTITLDELFSQTVQPSKSEEKLETQNFRNRGELRVAIENLKNGVALSHDDFARFEVQPKGSGETTRSSWDTTKNYLTVNAQALGVLAEPLDGFTVTNNTEGAKPVLDRVMDTVTESYTLILAGDSFKLSGKDFALDETQSDELVRVTHIASGTAWTAVVDYANSGVDTILAKLPDGAMTASTTGMCKVEVFTRSGLGTGYALRSCSHNIEFALAA